MALMGLMPASVSRRAIQAGDGPPGTPSRMVAVNRGQRSPLSTTRPATPRAESVGTAVPADTPDDGGAHGSPRAAARSRATPAMHRASERLGLMSMSNTTSGWRFRASTSGVPAGARPAGRIIRPSADPGASGSSSSPAEQSIPLDHSPRIFRRLIEKSPGKTAPTGASGTRSPSAKFQAPHTICRVSPPPVSTSTRRTRSASGWGRMASTLATTMSPSPSPTCSTPSTTRPSSDKVEARSATSRWSGA